MYQKETQESCSRNAPHRKTLSGKLLVLQKKAALVEQLLEQFGVQRVLM
jgi:hypothetical protein